MSEANPREEPANLGVGCFLYLASVPLLLIGLTLASVLGTMTRPEAAGVTSLTLLVASALGIYRCLKGLCSRSRGGVGGIQQVVSASTAATRRARSLPRHPRDRS